MRREATKGTNATLLCGYTIGRYTLIGSGAVVAEDIPDYVQVAGNPTKVVGYICQCDVLLEFNGPITTCSRCGLNLRNDGGDVLSL